MKHTKTLLIFISILLIFGLLVVLLPAKKDKLKSSNSNSVYISNKTETTKPKPKLLGFTDKKGYATSEEAIDAHCNKYKNLNCKPELLGSYKNNAGHLGGFFAYKLYTINDANLWLVIASVNGEPKWHDVYGTNRGCLSITDNFAIVSYCKNESSSN